MPAMRPCSCGYRAHGALLQIVVVRQTHAVRPQGELRSGGSIPPITHQNAHIASRYVYVPMFPATGTRKIIGVERFSEVETAARHSGVDWPI
jgi:hypothetical protein